MDHCRFTHALNLCFAAALLSGCGGAQTALVTPAAPSQGELRADRATATIRVLKRTPQRPGYRVTPPLLYVANSTHSFDGVYVYPANGKDPSPLATITDGVADPNGVCLDSVGTLYVANDPLSGPGWISEYPLGKTAPATTITNGINGPAFCAIDAKGNLWVANFGLDDIAEYPRGATKPRTIITNGLTRATGIAIDHHGNIYAGNLLTSGTSNVVVYAPGAKSPSRTITDGITYPVGMSVDSSGTLYVTNLEQNSIEEYRSGQDKPFRAITETTGHGPSDVTLNKHGLLYVSNFLDNTVAEFRSESLKPLERQISKEVWAPGGVAYYPAVLP